MSYARSSRVLLAVGATGALLALAGCGSPAEEASAPTGTSTTSQETPSEAATPPSPEQSEPESTPTPSPTETPAPEGTNVEVVIAGDQVTTASDRVEVTPGEAVSITVETDTADELHVHGVDMTFALEPGTTDVEFQVPADLAPGLYEVETHDSHLLLFSLVVA